MNKAKLTIIILGTLLMNTGSLARAQRPASDKKAEAEIRRTLSDWVRSTNSRDTAAANSIWEKNVIGWSPAVPEFSPIEAFNVAGLTPKRDASYSTYELKIDEIAVFGNIAAVYDIWTETRHFDGSTITAQRIIRSSELWKRQPGGGWKIARWVSAPEKWTRVGQ